MFDRCSISHFLSPISDLPFPISYFYVPFRSSFVHFPWLLARPGGMRGAIESAALVVDKSWRVKPKTKIHISDHILQISDPLKISPSAPAHSARPPQNHPRADFSIFHFARHWPSQMQKNCAGRTLLRICIKNASFKMPLS